MIPRNHVQVAAWLSRDVYLDGERMGEAVADYDVTLEAFIEHGDTQVALCRSEIHGAAFLAFRGTQPQVHHLQDILANLALYPSRWAGAGRAHSGYVAALERVRFRTRIFAEQVASEIPLYVTGHSMGGALATLYADWVSADVPDRHKLAGLITFGAPAAATMAAHGPMLDRMPVLRFTVPGDLAPLWPPFLFSHPVPASQLAAMTRWPDPLSRHQMRGYALSVIVGAWR